MSMSNLKDGWQTHLPDKSGDWQWVQVLACKCCVDTIGIVYITDPTYLTKDRYPTFYFYTDKNGVDRAMDFETEEPFMSEGHPCVTAWKKFEGPFAEQTL